MRLIDADELMEHAWRDKLDSRELIAKMIENAPAVVPVRHGRWVHGIRRGVNFDISGFECSSCGGWFMLRTNYCPGCGAKMKG